MLTTIQLGEEVSIREAGYLLPCRVNHRYMHNNEIWLILIEPQTKTQFRRRESDFLKVIKEVSLAEGGKY